MYERVLLPMDLRSQTMREIVARANFINQLGVRRFCLLHVMSPGLGNKRYVEKKMEEIEVMLYSYGYEYCYEVTKIIEEGSTADVICKVAREMDIPFIYIPGRCKNAMYYALLGSTSNDVVRLTDRTTFVHKMRPNIWKQENLNNILYATDFGEGASRALPSVKSLGSIAENVTVVNVRSRAADPIAEKNRKQKVVDGLENLQQDLESNFSSVEIINRIGTPAKVILAMSEEKSIDLIVLGRFYEGLKAKLLGSTAEEVAGKAKCSVLLVP